MSQHLSPYKKQYPNGVVKHYFQSKPPLVGLDMEKKLSKNLYLHEVVQASSIIGAETNLFVYVPLDVRLPKAFQALRDALKKPIYVSSAFRSERYELEKGRSGNSKHIDGLALDLHGEGLVKLIQESLETKNALYQKLRSLGINGFGIYKSKNFVHLDVRPPKQDGSAYVWTGGGDDEVKKNFKSISKILAFVAGLALTTYGFYKIYKNKKRK